MESFGEKDKFLWGYVAQRSFKGPSSFPRMPFRSSDVDFNDVFGGPPRRFSLHESTRYSSDWAMDSEETGVFRLSSEKPVFGEESSVNRRKHQSNDFFDDIFQGVKSCSSARRDFLNSLPASRITSPLRPLPGSELLDTSLPSHFSLPATLTRGIDYPTFASSSSTKKKEGTSNGISSLSRRSSQAIQEQDNSKNDVWPSNRPSLLSNEFSPGNEESSYLTKSNEKDTRENSKEDSKIAEAQTDNNPFHFSIYKWGSGEVPLELPLREDISNGKIKTDTETRHISVNFESSKMGRKRLDKTSTCKRAEAIHGEEEVLIKAKPETRDTTQITIENFLDFTILSNKSEEAKSSSLSEISLSEETKKEVYMVTEETHKPDLKLSCSFLHDEIEGQGNEDSIMKVEGKENVGKTTKVGASKIVKKNEGKRIDSNRTEVNKANIQSSPKNPGGNLDRSGVRGKVKDFVKIFNQETSLKSKGNEGKVAGGKVNEASVRITQMDTEMHFAGMNKMPDVSFLFPVDENVEEQEKHHSNMKFTTNTSTNNSCDQKDSSLFAVSSIPDGFEVATDNINDPFQENYLIQELSDCQVKLPHTSEDHEATKALDAKILKWSTGKKGNIRSLLSTLQYVVWEESGWKPVPLVNIIEANAVKKVYQKALLCLHPDKLQQKGTASHEKYIAEKVFDILQEAWDHFNSVGSV